jgi:hypothetical protein
MFPEPISIYNSDRYLVTHYDIDPKRLVIVFISAGGSVVAGQRFEEFRKSLLQVGASMVFVEDLRRWFFNHPDTDEMFAALNVWHKRYQYVGALGESMGACGAILATNYLKNICRVLGFAPQFSILSPFIEFDVAHRQFESRIDKHRYLNFARSPNVDSCQLLYGNCQWEDYLHSMMYKVNGFPVTIVNGANHGVAGHLKHHGRLGSLIERFTDFEKLFDREAIRTSLGEEFISSEPLLLENRTPPTNNPRYEDDDGLS